MALDAQAKGAIVMWLVFIPSVLAALACTAVLLWWWVFAA